MIQRINQGRRASDADFVETGQSFCKRHFGKKCQNRSRLTIRFSTIIRILEKKGFVDHDAFGKTHRYFSRLSVRAIIPKPISEIF